MITKQELIKILKEAREEASNNNFYIADDDGDGVCSLNVKYDEIIELAQELPNSERECEYRYVGKHQISHYETRHDYQCSNCGNKKYITAFTTEAQDLIVGEKNYNFCPHCGWHIKGRPNPRERGGA